MADINPSHLSPREIDDRITFISGHPDLPQRELADRLGISSGAINQFIKRHCPSKKVTKESQVLLLLLDGIPDKEIIAQVPISRQGLHYIKRKHHIVESSEETYEYTIEEIAQVLDLTPKEVIRLERSALRKMRNFCKQNGLSLSDMLPDAP